MTPLVEIRRKLQRFQIQKEQASANLETDALALAAAQSHETDCQKARQILQEVAEAVQNKALEQIASVVSRCLKTVFAEDAYDFHLRLEPKRGKTEVTILFHKDGVEMAEPLDESSGGQTEIAAFALRLVTIMLSSPKQRRLLVLDEPFKSVHGEMYRNRLAAMLPALAKELGFQIIIATGLDWLKIGKVIEL